MQPCNRPIAWRGIALAVCTGEDLHFMAGGKKDKKGASPKPGTGLRDPEWTAGLKRLYDSVVEEPLPDAFVDLLKKLDSAG